MTIPTTMRALQLQALNRLVEVQVPVPMPKPGEVLVRTVATTICTSDLNDIAHNPFGIALPRVMGHEGAGVVAVVGRGADGFSLGHPVQRGTDLLVRWRPSELRIAQHFENPLTQGAGLDRTPPVDLEAIDAERTVVTTPRTPWIGMHAEPALADRVREERRQHIPPAGIVRWTVQDAESGDVQPPEVPQRTVDNGRLLEPHRAVLPQLRRMTAVIPRIAARA